MEQNDKIITFETYHDPMLAHIMRTRLEAEGIPCFIEDLNLSGLNPIYNGGLSGIKLNIFERDLDKCRAILAADSTLQVEDHFEIDTETLDAIICPYCASTNVERIDHDKDRPDWVNTMYAFFEGVLPFYSPKKWHCLNCQQDFE